MVLVSRPAVKVHVQTVKAPPEEGPDPSAGTKGMTAAPQSGTTGMQSWTWAVPQAAKADRAVGREDQSEPGASAGRL